MQDDGGDMRDLCAQLAQEAGPLPPITGEDIRLALMAMPLRKASGIDAWTVEQIRRLTPELRETLAAILNRAEQEGGPPPWCEGPRLVSSPRGRALRSWPRGPLVSCPWFTGPGLASG